MRSDTRMISQTKVDNEKLLVNAVKHLAAKETDVPSVVGGDQKQSKNTIKNEETQLQVRMFQT